MLTCFDFQTLIQPNIFNYQNKTPTRSNGNFITRNAYSILMLSVQKAVAGSLNPGQVLTSLKGTARTCGELHHQHDKLHPMETLQAAPSPLWRSSRRRRSQPGLREESETPALQAIKCNFHSIFKAPQTLRRTPRLKSKRSEMKRFKRQFCKAAALRGPNLRLCLTVQPVSCPPIGSLKTQVKSSLKSFWPHRSDRWQSSI